MNKEQHDKITVAWSAIQMDLREISNRVDRMHKANNILESLIEDYYREKDHEK